MGQRIVRWFVPGLALAASAFAAGPGTPAPTTFHVALHDVHAARLIVDLTDLYADGRPVVVGGYGSTRIDLVGDFDDAGAALGKVLGQLEARSEMVDGIEVVRAPCVPEQRALVDLFAPREAIALDVANADPAGVLRLLDRPPPDAELPQSLGADSVYMGVSMRVAGSPAPAIYRALALATGLTAYRDAHGAISFDWPQACRDTQAAGIARVGAARSPCVSQASPGRATECYPRAAFTLKGYIREPRGTLAVAETPDGLTWVLRTGDRLGRDAGRIEAIDPHGVRVTETVQGADGRPRDTTAWMPF